MQHHRAGIVLHHGEDQIELVQLQGHSNRPIAVTVEDGWRVEDHPIFPLSEVGGRGEWEQKSAGPWVLGVWEQTDPPAYPRPSSLVGGAAWALIRGASEAHPTPIRGASDAPPSLPGVWEPP